MIVIPLIFLLICIFGAACIIWAVISAIRLISHFKSTEDRFSSKTLWNPLNALLYPDLLTDKGLSLRRQVGYAVVCFLASLACAFLVGLAAKLSA